MKYIILFPVFVIASGLVLFSCNNQPQQEKSPFSSEKSSAEKGARLFQDKCAICHSMTKDIAGPALQGVIARWENDTVKLKSFIRNSADMIKSGEPLALKSYDKFKTTMPSFPSFTEEEMTQLIAFLKD